MTCGHYTLCFKPVVFILYKQSHVWKPNVLNTLKKKKCLEGVEAPECLLDLLSAVVLQEMLWYRV